MSISRETKRDPISEKIEELEKQIQQYPKGTVTWKTIREKEQPYLQWTENGRTRSKYIKTGEREEILSAVGQREAAKNELKRLKAYYDKIRAYLQENPYLTGTEAIGQQYYDRIIDEGCFYIDKTYFLKDWWTKGRQVTLITRPRRFGKTLTLSMTECFFSTRYRDRSDLFEGLRIWKSEKMRREQGRWPVIFMTFAGVKSRGFKGASMQLCQYMGDLFLDHRYMLKDDILSDEEKEEFRSTERSLRHNDVETSKTAMKTLSRLLYIYHGKRVILLLDEYDTPVLEGWTGECLEEMMELMRNIFNNSLKTNPYLHRALLTGITRVAKESLFSDLNNLHVVTSTSPEYADVFGFTEAELFRAMDCRDVEEKQLVKEWYDGFTFGGVTDIYNPWSMVNYLADRQLRLYWANSGGYGMISRLFLKGKESLKNDLETLMQGGSIHKQFQENLNFEDLEQDSEAIWPFLLAAGYLRADNVRLYADTEADLSITNKETWYVFHQMVRSWFRPGGQEYREFCRYLLEGNVEKMNRYLNEMMLETVSFFDTEKHSLSREPEKFYHGLVLGLIAEVRDRYEILSNRESGFGRCDVLMKPRNTEDDGIILEFKVRQNGEASLEAAAHAALDQIRDKKYAGELIRAGIPEEKIRTYGLAFEGKQVLILRALSGDPGR